jgi:AcrR family transcriptional regulator
MDRRVAGNRSAVQQAALHILSTDGVAGLSVDRLAEISGVSRSTIYRHWPDMRGLVAATFAEIMHPTEPITDLSDPARALLAYLGDYANRLNQATYSTVLITILEWSWRDPEFARTQAQTFDDTRSRARAIVEAGRAARVFDTTLPIEDAVEAVVAPFLYRRLVLRRTITEREVRALHARLIAG